MAFLSDLPSIALMTLGWARAAARASSSGKFLANVSVARSLPFTCTGITISSSFAASASNLGQACWWMEYAPPIRAHNSSAICGAIGANKRTKMSMASAHSGVPANPNPARVINLSLAGSGMPVIVPGMLVALISASPEIMTALRAALEDRMQPVVNIALGASLSTVILTVPVIEAIALLSGQPIEMALTAPQTVMMVLTLLAATINLHDGETNAIEGTAHFVLFLTFLMLAALGV